MKQDPLDPLARTVRAILILLFLPPTILAGLWIYSAWSFGSLFPSFEGTPSVEQVAACLEVAELTPPEDVTPEYWHYVSGLDDHFELKFATSPQSAAALIEQASQFAKTQPDVTDLMRGSHLYIEKPELDRSIAYEQSDGTIVRIASSKPIDGRTSVCLWYWEF